MKIHWKKLLSREGIDITTIFEIDLIFYDWIWKFTKTRNELFFTYFYDKHFTHYIGIDPQELGWYLYKKYFNSPEKIKKYYQEGKILLQSIRKCTNRWQRKLHKNSENRLFISACNNFKEQFKKINYVYSITPWLVIEAWQSNFEEMISTMIKRNNLIDEKEQIFFSVYKPWKRTAINEIQNKIKRGEKIQKLVKEYQFLRNWSVIWYRPIDKLWIKSLGQISIDKKYKKTYSSKEIINLLKPNSQEKHHLQLVPYMIFFKDWRDDLRREHVYYWSFLFQLIAEKFNVNYQDLGYLTLEEIENCLNLNKLEIEVIERRKNNFCIITVEGNNLKMQVIDKNIPRKYKTIINKIADQERQFEIKGLVAQKGKLIGKVKIVKSYHDIKRIQNGDILVANTTHPNYLPGMHRAAAFVTNEGGIASHAAIVAREMKKPCIVGTKIATKVLKDGDLVEVDAEKGIVRIIKRIQ